MAVDDLDRKIMAKDYDEASREAGVRSMRLDAAAMIIAFVECDGPQAERLAGALEAAGYKQPDESLFGALVKSRIAAQQGATHYENMATDSANMRDSILGPDLADNPAA